MIEPIPGRHVNTAKAVCDTCGHTEQVRCKYQSDRNQPNRPNEGQIIKRLTGQGWSFVKHTLRCPTCEAARKPQAPEEEPMQADAEPAQELRQPSAKQKREIIALLELAYDDEKKRYKGADTDKTLAEAAGDGILWGWVTQIREELFGPDSRNVEIEQVTARLAELETAMVALDVVAATALQAVSDDLAKVAANLKKKAEALQRDINALKSRLQKMKA